MIQNSNLRQCRKGPLPAHLVHLYAREKASPFCWRQSSSTCPVNPASFEFQLRLPPWPDILCCVQPVQHYLAVLMCTNTVSFYFLYSDALASWDLPDSGETAPSWVSQFLKIGNNSPTSKPFICKPTNPGPLPQPPRL